MKKIYYLIIIVIILFASMSFSCRKHEEPLGDIELPPAPMISRNESWAVIEASYLRLRERPEEGASLVTTLWRGYVLEIMSRSSAKSIIDDEEDYWYQVNYDGLQGWVFGSYLEIYDSREEAEVEARAVRAD